MTLDLFGRPALLFLPASNPRAIARARDSAADVVVLDLEDAVKPGDKDAARAAAAAALAAPWPMQVAVRINGVGTDHHGADLAMIAAHKPPIVVVPMVTAADEIHGINMIVGHKVVAMIEHATAVLDARAIAGQSAALIVGTNDLSSSLRLPKIDRPALSASLQLAVLAARDSGIAVFDGVYNQLDDPDGFAAECADSRRLGFDGKSLIHPDQIAPCHAAFAPTEAELARAERLVAAASGGAERFEGAMVEEMHVEAARRLLARR